jgi:hypothetical protein
MYHGNSNPALTILKFFWCFILRKPYWFQYGVGHIPFRAAALLDLAIVLPVSTEIIEINSLSDTTGTCSEKKLVRNNINNGTCWAPTKITSVNSSTLGHHPIVQHYQYNELRYNFAGNIRTMPTSEKNVVSLSMSWNKWNCTCTVCCDVCYDACHHAYLREKWVQPLSKKWQSPFYNQSLRGPSNYC